MTTQFNHNHYRVVECSIVFYGFKVLSDIHEIKLFLHRFLVYLHFFFCEKKVDVFGHFHLKLFLLTHRHCLYIWDKNSWLVMDIILAKDSPYFHSNF